ncbi:hypothetical protein KAX17_04015 [Candidatus Bipolaricaulota bacterium]|nr:hypothetical protein [Candidatus Bipolaricaulota bacterium]
MTAGLPKVGIRTLVLLLCIVMVLLLHGLTFGQDVQTGSNTAADLIEDNTILSPIQKDTLTGLLNDALTGGFLTDDEALTLVNAGLGALTSDNVDAVVQALEIVLNAVNEGQVDPEGAITALTLAMESEDPVGTLEDLLNEQASPPGILNAISRAAFAVGYTQTDSLVLLEKVNAVISEELPPGIVLRVVKDALRSGLDPVKQLTALRGLIVEEEESPGQAATKVTGKGQYKSQDEEQNGDQGAKGKGKGKGKPKKDNKGQGKKG